MLKPNEQLSNLLMALSLVAAALGAIGAIYTDVYLASTQYALVAILLGIYGLYVKP